LEDNDGGDLSDIWFTVDGKNYSNWHYDIGDAVYGSDPEIEEDLFTDGYTDELMVADNASQICLKKDQNKQVIGACSYISKSTEIHFSYPAAWQTTVDTP
jgi:hypothetical protein